MKSVKTVFQQAKVYSPILFLFFSIAIFVSFKCNTREGVYRVVSTEMSNTFRIGDFFKIRETKKISRNDFACFKVNFSIYGIKLEDTTSLRVVGLPGEHIKISQAKIWINESVLPNPPLQKRGYIVDTRDIKDYKSDVALIKPYSGFLLTDDYALLNLDSGEYRKMKANRMVIPLEEYANNNFEDTILIYKIKVTLSKADTMPSIYIPRKGDTISIPSGMVKYYSSAITQFRKLDEDKYVVNDNMYFMIGDNWCDAIDSREFGLISEKDIIGILEKQSDRNK